MSGLKFGLHSQEYTYTQKSLVSAEPLLSACKVKPPLREKEDLGCHLAGRIWDKILPFLPAVVVPSAAGALLGCTSHLADTADEVKMWGTNRHGVELPGAMQVGSHSGSFPVASCHLLAEAPQRQGPKVVHVRHCLVKESAYVTELLLPQLCRQTYAGCSSCGDVVSGIRKLFSAGLSIVSCWVTEALPMVLVSRYSWVRTRPRILLAVLHQLGCVKRSHPLTDILVSVPAKFFTVHQSLATHHLLYLDWEFLTSPGYRT